MEKMTKAEIKAHAEEVTGEEWDIDLKGTRKDDLIDAAEHRLSQFPSNDPSNIVDKDEVQEASPDVPKVPVKAARLYNETEQIIERRPDSANRRGQRRRDSASERHNAHQAAQETERAQRSA